MNTQEFLFFWKYHHRISFKDWGDLARNGAVPLLVRGSAA